MLNAVVAELSIYVKESKRTHRFFSILDASSLIFLNEGDWEPEIICAELPEFLQFVRQVQDFISCNSNKTADQE